MVLRKIFNKVNGYISSTLDLSLNATKKVLAIFLVLISSFSYSQTYPITITTILSPSFSGYLLDYADPASEKLKVLIQFNDFTVPQYKVKLKFEIKGNGFSMVTKSVNNVAITLTPGSPTILSGDALFPYLKSDNLDFTGINQNLYEQGKVLPEGNITICVTAYDAQFQPGKQVSNEACAMVWFALNDPPLLNMPLCNSVITQQTPQNVLFQWTSMNLGSSSSSNTTEYLFQLWEMRDTMASPNVIAQSTVPIYEQTTQQTFVNFGPGESPLNPYARYVWRVQAKDQNGRALFKNQGYSQVCTFKNGDMAEEIGNSIHLELTGQAVSHRLAKCSWETNNLLDSYLLQVRKEGTENWFDFETTNNNEKIPNLEPSTTYEARLQGKSSVNGISTGWSNTVSFTTLAPPNYSCNDQNAPIDALQAQPLAASKAIPGLIIQSGQFEVFTTSNTPNGTPGWYKGSGYALVFGALPLAVKWDNIYIDDNNRHQQGQIDALSKGIGSFTHQYDVNQGQENAIYVPDGTLDSVYAANGQICYSLSGSDSSVCADYPPNTNVVVVRDGEGNQYIVTIYPEPATVEGPFNYMVNLGDSTEILNELDGKPSDTLLHVAAKIDSLRYFRNGESIYLSKLTSENKPLSLSKIAISKFIGKNSKNLKVCLPPFCIKGDWYVNDVKKEMNNKKYDFLLDSSGIFKVLVKNFKSYIWAIDSAKIDFTKHPLLEKTAIVYDTIQIMDSIEIIVNVVDKPFVKFLRSVPFDGGYGYDSFEIKDFEANYSSEIIDGKKYYVPWMTMKKRDVKTIKANVLVPTMYEGLKIKFELSDNSRYTITSQTVYDSTSLTIGSNLIDVSVENKNSSVIDSCWINVRDDKDALIGKIVLITKPTIIREYQLIFVMSDTNNYRTINKELVNTELNAYLNNNIYNQTFIEWNSKELQILDLRAYKSQINSKSDSAVSLFLKDKYKLNHTVRNNMHYIFVYDGISKNGYNGLGGFSEDAISMSQKPLFSMIFYHRITKYSTYAHELGHNLTMNDVVTQYPSIGYSTQNIMDYSAIRNMFWYWQIIKLYKLGTNKHN